MDASTRTTLSRLLGFILLMVSMAAAQARPPVAGPNSRARSPRRPAAYAQLNYCADECKSWERSFAVDSVRDLNMVVTWTSWLTPGAHVQRLELISPAGEPFQQIDTSFEAATVTRNRLGQPTLRASLPLAGSWIQQRKLTGNWTLNLYLDGSLVTSSSLKLE